MYSCKDLIIPKLKSEGINITEKIGEKVGHHYVELKLSW